MDMSNKYTSSYEEYITDAKIVALLKVLEKTNPDIWDMYKNEFDEELIRRDISPSEETLGYRES